VSARMPGRTRDSCALCGTPEREHLFAKDGYPIARCRACGLVRVDVELERRQLKEIYNEDYFTKDELFHGYVAERNLRLQSGARFAQTLARLVPRGRLLDVGCAAGFFLHAASRHYEVTGVELSPYASEYARREFGLRVLTGDVTEAGLEGELFDVVTLWNTIEHMAEPLIALHTIAALTRPGGLLVVSTGDVTGPLARRGLAEWNLMSPPYHLFFFSPRTIGRLLATVGFRLRRIVYDGVVAAGGPLASGAARRAATVAGLGNVMTVYASRERSAVPSPSRVRRLAARYRPLRLVLSSSP
jgi:SAM-dependent methyltransferase